jgi:threonine aldolase
MMIDLRSDTVTRPSERMRRAMAEAEVGDDVFREDPTVNRLEARAAELFDRPAALFVPSGSMGNLIAIHAHTTRGDEVICEERSHIVHHEMSSMAAIAGVLPRTIATPDGVLSWEAIERAIPLKLDFNAWTGLIVLENTHNHSGGTVYPPERVTEITERAHEREIPVHLDGARIWNAAVALGRSVKEITRGADSVMFCLSKGLGAPVGSLLVGSAAFIERARRLRKMLGGGMRQAGVVAAAGLVALEDGPRRLQIDHDHARRLAEGIAEVPGLVIDPARVRTNIVVFGVPPGDAFGFFGRLAERGVLALPLDERSIRMVTHCDVGPEDIERAIVAAREAAAG